MARPQLTDSTSFNNCSSQIRNLNPTFPCIAFRIKASPFLPMQGLYWRLHSVNGGLTKLSLAENNLGEEGTKAICEALEKNETLKELDLRGPWRRP